MRRPQIELLVWIVGIIALALIDPAAGNRPDLCILHRLGLVRCPGCGLGASIHFLLRMDLAASWRAHPLGIPALAILLARSVVLARGWFRTISEGRNRKERSDGGHSGASARA